jgi:putative NADH-flavin reductase
MKILIYGAGGTLGSRIAAELLDRGHQVTAGVRSAERASGLDARLTTDASDVTDAASVASAAAGHDAVVSAVSAPHDGSAPTFYVDSLQTLVGGLRAAGVRRLALVGGAGSLAVAPGLDLVDTPEFPALWKSGALAHREALRAVRTVEDLDWVYFSPAALIEPGERTGAFRLGGDQLLVDAAGVSRISAEDFAIAVADALESGEPVRQRITVAY